MNDFARLAGLLEDAAKLLREAGAALDGIRPVMVRLQDMKGYWKLSVRTHNGLSGKSGMHRGDDAILTRSDLLNCTPGDLLERRNFGASTLTEVEKWLEDNDLKLRQD